MGKIAIGGDLVEVPGVRAVNFKEGGPRAPGRQTRPRTTGWVRNICLHTTRGIPGGDDKRSQDIRDGAGPAGAALDTISWIESRFDVDGSYGSYHLIVDFDGTVYSVLDAKDEVAYHARGINEVSVGVALVQGEDAQLYDAQLQAAFRLLGVLTEELRIQRQIPNSSDTPTPRLESAEDFVGIFGHRDVTDERGSGDPGDAIMNTLRVRDYEEFDVGAEEDKERWKGRQRALNRLFDEALAVDGIPGPKTAAALERNACSPLIHPLFPGIWIAERLGGGDLDAAVKQAFGVIGEGEAKGMARHFFKVAAGDDEPNRG